MYVCAVECGQVVLNRIASFEIAVFWVAVFWDCGVLGSRCFGFEVFWGRGVLNSEYGNRGVLIHSGQRPSRLPSPA